MHSQNFLSPHTQTIWGTSMFKGLSIEEAWLMAVESAALALLPLWHSDPVVRVPLTCLFLSNLNGTFNMTRQTKQIKPMISRSREPDQTRSQRADLMICRQKRVGQGGVSSFSFHCQSSYLEVQQTSRQFTGTLDSLCKESVCLTYNTHTCSQSIFGYLAPNNWSFGRRPYISIQIFNTFLSRLICILHE